MQGAESYCTLQVLSRYCHGTCELAWILCLGWPLHPWLQEKAIIEVGYWSLPIKWMFKPQRWQMYFHLHKHTFWSCESQTFFSLQPLYCVWSVAFTATSPLLPQKPFNWPLGQAEFRTVRSKSTRDCRHSVGYVQRSSSCRLTCSSVPGVLDGDDWL